jgi:hypothetical protein
MIKHKVFLVFTFCEVMILVVLLLYCHFAVTTQKNYAIPAKRELVKSLQLTDLSLWTEARYTRNPSQADIFTPFQDFPSSLEHFPAGSIIGPESIIASEAVQSERP